MRKSDMKNEKNKALLTKAVLLFDRSAFLQLSILS